MLKVSSYFLINFGLTEAKKCIFIFFLQMVDFLGAVTLW